MAYAECSMRELASLSVLGTLTPEESTALVAHLAEGAAAKGGRSRVSESAAWQNLADVIVDYENNDHH